MLSYSCVPEFSWPAYRFWGSCLPRVTVWVPSWKVHHWHSVLCMKTVGEMPWTEQALYLAFIDLTKAFDLVSRSGLFKILKKVGCPSRLLAVTQSFHEDMQSTVCYNGATSEPFPMSSGVKQGCMLAPTLFGIFFSMLLSYAFHGNDDGLTGASSTWPDSRQRPRYRLSPSEKPCLLTMQPRWPIPNRRYRGLWTAYPKHVVNLAWPSASRRLK